MEIANKSIHVLLCLLLVGKPFASASTSTIIYIDEDKSEMGTEAGAGAGAGAGGDRTISIEGDTFMLNGRPMRLLSGSLHYFRLPHQYWADRLMKIKAAGLNAVATYVEWSWHEPEERRYMWEGDRDLVAFVREAQKIGLLVLLRPGPYICAERDLGGLPYWLLRKYPNIKLRSTDRNFIMEMNIWMEKVFVKMTPLLYKNGGPIILVQVENEYGSYGGEVAYMEAVRDSIAKHVSDAALLYTTDGYYPDMISKGSVRGALTTIDFGINTNTTAAFGNLRRRMPSGPLVNSEFYPGWLTHWGEPMQRVATEPFLATMKKIIETGANFNVYVFYGGTNFGYTAGANHIGGNYQPDITSYDYDAPITEAGDLTPKYHAIRALLKEYFPDANAPTPPGPSSKRTYGCVTLRPRIGLLSEEGRSVLGTNGKRIIGTLLPTFEELRQRGGLVLYETALPPATNGISRARLLRIARPRDRVYVYLEGEYLGVISRMHNIYNLPIRGGANNTRLSLLVESQGRINYGSEMHDFKGLVGEVTVDGSPLSGEWSVLGYALEDLSPLDDDRSSSVRRGEQTPRITSPAIYEGSFTLPMPTTSFRYPEDTFVDTRGWGKGYIWINGRNLGRYWPSVGPQVTLYLPGCWLRYHPEENSVRVLELETAPEKLALNFLDEPILERAHSTAIRTNNCTLI